MTTKYTPGPWETKESATHIRVVGANNEVLFHDDKRVPMVKADARLIAAAPELLDGCKVALTYIEAVCFNTPNPKKRKNYADCASNLRAAIAKATGEKE